MKHKESDLQIRCVNWFRYQYPEFARLMEHPKNEGNGNRRQGAIAKAEGVTKGVADLILHVPSFDTVEAEVPVRHYEIIPGTGMCSFHHEDKMRVVGYNSLAIEMKTPTGTQSAEQKEWQRLFEAAGGLYIIVRSYDDFVSDVTKYMLNVPVYIKAKVKEAAETIQHEQDERVKKQLKSFVKKS